MKVTTEPIPPENEMFRFVARWAMHDYEFSVTSVAFKESDDAAKKGWILLALAQRVSSIIDQSGR